MCHGQSESEVRTKLYGFLEALLVDGIPIPCRVSLKLFLQQVGRHGRRSIGDTDFFLEVQ